RVLDGVEARTLRKHPTGEDALLLAVELYLVHLDERRRLRLLFGRARVADARRDLELAELGGRVEWHFELGGARRHLVESGEDGDAVVDAIGVRAPGEKHARTGKRQRRHCPRVRSLLPVSHSHRVALQLCASVLRACPRFIPWAASWA